MDEPVEVLHEAVQGDDRTGAFYVPFVEGPHPGPVDGRRAAEMTYSYAGSSTIVIDHTEVSDLLRGRGAGRQLVYAAVAFARASKLKIRPRCSFARAVFDKEPELRDVLVT
ncbi:MAG: GNAT family N-acetyltransferase [Myxococcota bacterium]